MTKPIIVTDFAYKGVKRTGRGTGHQGLRSTLKYYQFREDRNTPAPQETDHERWVDRGLGQHYREIFTRCDNLQSKHVLAWTWVVSPSPDLMAIVPEDQRRDLVIDLTERIVEAYYTARGFEVPEYAFVLHDRMTTPEDGSTPLQHLHTHVVLPGTAPLPGADRAPVYNNKDKGHDALIREIGTRLFAETLDEIVGADWRLLRDDPVLPAPDNTRGDDFMDQ